MKQENLDIVKALILLCLLLTLIWVAFLGVRFEVKGRGARVGKITPSLKLVRIMLELWYVSTQTDSVSENIRFSIKTLLISYQGPQHFLQKISIFRQK